MVPGTVFGVAVCMCVEMSSDSVRGCRGSRTVGTLCVASAWRRCGTSQRPSGPSASCPTALTPTAWAACAPGGRADRTSRWMSSSQCHGEAHRREETPQRGVGSAGLWACDYSSLTSQGLSPVPSPFQLHHPPQILGEQGA